MSALEAETGGIRQTDGNNKNQLNKVYSMISDVKSRMGLIRNLMSKHLATREIFSFIEGLRKLRSEIKTLDFKTMISAMTMMLMDLKKALTRLTTTKQNLDRKIIWENET